MGSLLGEGARGVVFQAEQLGTGRQVALKFLHPHIAENDHYLNRFQREIEIATRFDHPSIIRVFDVGETAEGLHYLVMELLEGEDLKEVLEKAGPLPSSRVFAIGRQLLDGLAEAHSHEIVHRDIKPANVFVAPGRREEDVVKLLDFGIARLMDPDVTRLTSAGTFTGTPAYMPPEVFVLEDAPGHKRADVYSTGLVLLEMMLGRRVIPKCRLDQLVGFHLATAIPLPAAIADTALGKVIRRATMKHPGDRFTDAEEMLKAFEEAAVSTPAFQLQESDLPPMPSMTGLDVFNQLALAKSPAEQLEVLRRQPQHSVYPSRAEVVDSHSPSPSPSSSAVVVEPEPEGGQEVAVAERLAVPEAMEAPVRNATRGAWNRRLILFAIVGAGLFFVALTGLFLIYFLLVY